MIKVFRILAYFIVIIVLIVFATQNMEPVTIYLVVGPPVAVPLIVAIVLAFIFGYAFALFGLLLGAAKRNRWTRVKAELGS
jgi:uncharacterized integral membrane protein